MENKPTYEELLDRVTEMELDLEALKTELLNANSREQSKPMPPHPRWKPERDDLYYVTSFGMSRAHYWKNDVCDHSAFAAGNLYQTEDEAEFAVERQKVLTEMREWAGAIDDPWHIYYSSRDKKVIVGEWTMPHMIYGDLRFAMEEDARNCINAVGADRIKKYYLGISEDQDGTQT